MTPPSRHPPSRRVPARPVRLLFLPIGLEMFPFVERTGHTFLMNIGYRFVAAPQVQQARGQDFRSALVATQLHLNISMRVSEILVKMLPARFAPGFFHSLPPRCSV